MDPGAVSVIISAAVLESMPSSRAASRYFLTGKGVRCPGPREIGLVTNIATSYAAEAVRILSALLRGITDCIGGH